MSSPLVERPQVVVACAWLVLSIAICVAAIPKMLDLGLYYDEAFMAQQARGFVEPERAGQHPGSVRELSIAGRPFPVRNAAYLGSLKSQLLIPAFAAFGADPLTLRVATLAVGLLSLWLSMAWAAQILGPPAAVLGGLLIATDPSFFFFSQFEWGPFTTNLLCRMAGLVLVTFGWQRQRSAALVAGGLAFGLGIYSRADFAVVLAAMAGSVALCDRALVRRVLRERPWALAGTAAALVLGAAPTLVVVPEILQTGAGIAGRGGLAYKANVLESVLDGSHFARLMAVGGRFDVMFGEGDAPRSLGTLALLATGAVSALAALGGRLRGRRAFGFVAATTLAITIAMLFVPGAVRAHHMLNAVPFYHLWMGATIALLWSGALGLRAPVARPIAAVFVLLLTASNLRVIAATQADIERTGGPGRFARDLSEVVEALDRPERTFVSLDWGFHEPVLFLTDHADAVEPIWLIPRQLRAGRPWIYQGDRDTVYLVHDESYDLFGIGPELSRTAGRHAPDRASIEWHGDQQAAFATIRFHGAHRLSYDGTFRVRFEDPTQAP